MNANTVFDPIFGHEEQCRQLTALLQGRAVPHALMFAGPSGIGKRTVALRFAAALLSPSSSPDQTQTLIASGNHPDLHFLAREPEKRDLPVEAIRALTTKLQLKPYCGTCSVAIIDNAHEMNLAASNALLMTLEEPPPDTYLILTTDAPQVLPQTIVSRCQILHFTHLNRKQLTTIIEYLLPGQADASLLNALAAYGDSSLEPLRIEQFINAKTSIVRDPEALVQHLQELLGHIRRLDKLLEPLFSAGPEKEQLAYPVALATHIAGDDALLSVCWHTIMSKLRENMRHSASPGPCADALLAVVDAEKLTRQRSLNMTLQLSNVLMKIAQC
ncbi:MAG TPA: hypothetical protein PLP17_16205 [Oligoflexia bacterium]|nr:hypothetical protein [Oligoflexia bacterium]